MRKTDYGRWTLYFKSNDKSSIWFQGFCEPEIIEGFFDEGGFMYYVDKGRVIGGVGVPLTDWAKKKMRDHRLKYENS